MKFFRFKSIDNSYRTKTTKRYKEENVAQGTWCLQEKIDGTNFSLWYNGKDYRWASRSGFLGGMDDFFNCDEVVEEHQEKIKKIYEYIGATDHVAVYGELFGGCYPHPDVTRVDGAAKIQCRVKYSPGNHFYAFDVLKDGEFMNIQEALDALNACGFLAAEIEFSGTLDECLEKNPNFETKLPERLGLPKIENNFSEGYVLKPMKTKRLKTGERVILKLKSEKFKETKAKNTRVTPRNPMTPEEKEIFEIVETYITVNRLKNVVGNFGEVRNKDFGALMGLFNKDIFKDFESDHDLLKPIGATSRKKIKKEISNVASQLLRKYIVQIIDKEEWGDDD